MTPRRSIIPIFVPHLGCPHFCVFCNQNRISGSEKPATADDVRRTIEESLSRLGEGAEPVVAFYGGSFTAIPESEQEALLSAAYEYVKTGRVRDLRLSTRPDAIDGAVISRLKKYGVRTVELGVQSMDEDVLRASGRGHTAMDAERAAKAIKCAGFELILQMMTGLPGDTAEKDVSTAKKFIELKPDGVRIYPTVIVKDTELFELWKNGSYKEHTVEDAVELGAELLDMFEAAGIPVIRFGLNPTEDLSNGDAAGGAYHPALRELAEARRYLKLERSLLSREDEGKEIVFAVQKGRLSQAVGQGRANKNALISEYGLKSALFTERDMSEKLIRIK
ncbi:MAG: radical SAM protein [Spirochaetales bacterium]|nr:radical SAM protein [Spirochaetales bacterium]